MERTEASPAGKAIDNVDQLEDLLSEPSGGVIEALDRLEGDIIVLGVGGKMGPTLARMAKRASEATGSSRRVIGVSRFSSPGEDSKLQAAGVETIQCDLMDHEQLERLPDVPNVVFMAGMKFGTTCQQSLTWAMNSFLPGMVCRKYHSSRIVAFSTGNIYGMVPVDSGGSVETDAPSPQGEYAMSALGRERIFEHFSRSSGVPVALIRLNYAIDLRYGVLLDIANRVYREEPVDLAMGYVNVIWQGDANAMALMAFDCVSAPPAAINVTGTEQLSVRWIAEQFASAIGKPVTSQGTEADEALLSNAQRSYRLFGYPRVSVQQMIEWTADWVMRGGESLGKPTHFEARDGNY